MKLKPVSDPLVGKLIDPPSGWRYGFPKKYEPLPNENMRQFLLRNKYPEQEVDFAMQYMRVIGE